MAVAPSRSAPPGETLVQHGARSCSTLLEQRRPFHILSGICGLLSIPIIRRAQIDGTWIAKASQLIHDSRTLKGATGVMAGYVAMYILTNVLKGLKAPTNDRVQNAANAEMITQLGNAMNGVEQAANAPNCQHLPLLTRFHQIMRAFDVSIWGDGIAEEPVKENPPAAFAKPFGGDPAAAPKEGEDFVQHAARSFSTELSHRGVFHALSIISGLPTIPIINRIKLDGKWAATAGGALHSSMVLKGVAGIVTGYVTMVALKYIMKGLKAPNSDRAKHEKNIKTLAQLAYAMTMVETRNPGAKDSKHLSMLKRFNNIIDAYKRLLENRVAPVNRAQPAGTGGWNRSVPPVRTNGHPPRPLPRRLPPSDDGVVDVRTGDDLMTDAQLSSFVSDLAGAAVSEPEMQRMQSRFAALPPQQKQQVQGYIAYLQAQETAADNSGSGGTHGSGSGGGTHGSGGGGTHGSGSGSGGSGGRTDAESR
jgi:hypothetical protein